MDIVTTDIYSFIYTTLANLIAAEVPDIKYVDLYDSQPLRPKEEESYDLPALFIEFKPVQWTQRGARSRRALIEIDIHIETNREGTETSSITPTGQQPRGLYYLNLNNQVYKALQFFSSGAPKVGFGSMLNVGDHLNINEDVTRVDIMIWQTQAQDDTAVPDATGAVGRQTIEVTGT